MMFDVFFETLQSENGFRGSLYIPKPYLKEAKLNSKQILPLLQIYNREGVAWHKSQQLPTAAKKEANCCSSWCKSKQLTAANQGQVAAAEQLTAAKQEQEAPAGLNQSS